MKTKFRNYTKSMRFTEDFHKVSAFLKRMALEQPQHHDFEWVRWEWGVSHPYLDVTNLDKIGLWEDASGELVGLATYEWHLGEAWLVCDPAHAEIHEEMLEYAIANLRDADGKIKVFIKESDRPMQQLARAHGLRPTRGEEHIAMIEVTDELSYSLPDGYTIVSMQDEYDIPKFNAVLWKGFDHGDTPPESEEEFEMRRTLLSGPHNDLDLKICVKAPNGEFAAFSGAWYDPASQTGHVEPVATDPAYRKLGLGKAAVLEGVIRCGKLGAKRVYVGSSQQFYYNIGFDPVETYTVWETTKEVL